MNMRQASGISHDCRQLALVLILLIWIAGSSAPAQYTPTRLGDLDTDGRPTVLDLTRLIGHLNGSNILSASLQPWADINEDGQVNTNDLALLQNAILGLAPLPNPYSAPVLNAQVSATNGSSIVITGTARPNRQILVTGGRFAVFAVADSNGRFSVTVDLRLNQLNNLFVTALSSNFPAGTPQPFRILQDSQPPNLYIDFPTNGQTLYTSNTVIAGRVGDMLSGFMGLGVTLRSQPASSSPYTANVNVGIGNNGTFERSLVPLAQGTNLITVTATDKFGNQTNRSITILYQPVATNQPRLELVWGDLQATNIHRRLAQPLIVKALQASGAPFANKLVTLEVTRSDGRLLPVDAASAANPSALTNDITRTPHGIMSLQLFTDASGEARAWWALGGDAGCGNNRVCAMSAGISNAVYFCATARPAAVHQINIGTGNNQKAETGGFVPEPLRAWVSDSCNGIEGLPITFTIIQGGGRLFPRPLGGGEGQGEGASSITATSSITGHAEALLQLGHDAGQNIIEANYPGNPGLPATFIAYGVARDPSQPTRLSGLVLDNTSCPLGGALCSASVGGQLFFTATDVQGQFHFTNTPAGPAFLTVNGSTATNLLGATIPTNSFPSLEFALILIPNAENSLPSPVLLPRLNLNNQRLYYGTNDLVLTCAGMEGLKMTIKANSMRKPDGSLVTPANPTTVSLNQVHHDNVPMPMPDGASPPFAWTLQPGGSTFDPPITIEYPNMSGLPAGTVAYFLSFNHDTRRFEIIASGHVAYDSATIVTDPGAGLNVAGWGCNCPPYSVTGSGKNCCRIAVAFFQGGPGFIGPIIWSSGSLNPLYRAVRNLDRNHIFARVFGSSSSLTGQEDPARTWIQGLQVDGCPRPITVLIGHSLGGDTVNLSSSIASDLRVSIDPISRARALNFLTACEFYQRDLPPLVGLADVNYLAADIASAQELADCRMPGCTSSSCLRGYHVAGASESEIPGSDHSSIVASVQPAIVAHVRSLLPAPALPQGGFAPAGESPDADVFLDANFTLSVGGQGVQAGDDGSFTLRNASAPDQFGSGGPGTAPDFVGDDYVRLTGQSTVCGTNRYVFSEFFQIRQRETISITNLTFTDIPPRKPESLAIGAATNVMTVLGQTNQLRVIARYADGGTNDVAPRTSWTTYRVSNPNIATVTPDGGVIGRARGVVYVTAVNEGVAAVVLLAVSPDDTLTTVVGVVRDTNGVPVAGATVTAGALGMSGITDADGRFVISGVPSGLGSLTVTAVLLRGTNLPLVAVSAFLTPVPGGTTDAGVLVARPGWPGMAFIPAGPFTMGDTFGEGFGDDLPLHTNQISAFLMDQYEVTKALWDEVYNWAITHGYSFEFGAQGKTNNHPAQSVTWYDAAKWCNARSEKAGLVPAYYTSAAQANVYRSGQVNVDNSWVKWSTGFRLPTEAEWEKAARGGASGRRFPWSDTDNITHSRANYYSSTSYAYDTSPTRGYHPTFSGVSPYTSPVGYFAPNGYGLYDMAGNVWEWCWDWYGNYSSVAQTDPRGPTTGSDRAFRGGSWYFYAFGCRAAYRDYYDPAGRYSGIGFRSVLPPGQP